MKWYEKGWLSPSLTSEDGVWKIYADEFGLIACKKVGTNKGWYLNCQYVDKTAISLAEAKINRHVSNKLDHIT